MAEQAVIQREKGRKWWFRIALFIAPRLVGAYFRLVDLTSRKIFLNREYEEQVRRKHSFACACFHGTMLFPLYYCRKYSGVAMVSRSWDGELIDRCLKRWNYETTRGSSSSGGKEALRELIEVVKEKGCCSGIAVDAPRGPARKVKIGIVIVARETGQPVFPLASRSTRQIMFNSWDKMVLPLPFGSIVTAFGKPTEVPPNLSNDEYEKLRQSIEDEMNLISQQVEDKVAELKGASSVNGRTGA